VAYEIVSDVDHNTIRANVNVPTGRPPAVVILRLRHPRAARMKSVTVNGKPWADFDAEKETITLKHVGGAVGVVASY
jgi:hypothetical protein